MQTRLPTPTEPQRLALASPARFLVNRWGRGAGKSMASLMRLHRDARSTTGLYWWVWPTLKSGREFAWEQYVRPYLGSNIRLHESTLTATYPNGSRLQIVGADKSRAHNMRGGAVHGAVLDECRNMHRAVWTEILLPMIARTKGWAWFNSTPRGHDWFWSLWESAKRSDGWGRFHFTSADNPHIDPLEVARMKDSMTEREYRQEVLAEFLTDGGLVFRNVDTVCTARPQNPTPGKRYIIGADFALKHDNTVFSVFDIGSKTQVHESAYKGVDSLLQARLLADLALRYNRAIVIAEINNMGEPIARLVEQRGIDVVDFTTTLASKKMLIDGAVMAFESGAVRLLKSEENVAEFSSFEGKKVTSGGILRYGAPDGVHDDRVMAACLAIHGMESSVSDPRVTRDLARAVAF